MTVALTSTVNCVPPGKEHLACGVQPAAGILMDMSTLSAEAFCRKENEAKKDAAKAIASSATKPPSQAAPRRGLRPGGEPPADAIMRSNG
jgi:hypothetical protein